jgi:DnaJ-class molecular chaperone
LRKFFSRRHSSVSTEARETKKTKTDGEEMSDGSTRTSFQRPQPPLRKDVSKGRTLKTTMVISIGDSATGGRKVIQVARQEACKACAAVQGEQVCESCRGERVVSVSTNVQVDVPAGVLSGFSAVVPGAGDAADDVQQMPGDLIVEVQVHPHPFLRRLGNDCHAELPLSFSQATLGCKLRIPSLYGQATVTVPPGTQSHTLLSVPDEGFPIPGPEPKRGAMVVRVLVTVPKNVSAEDAALLRQFDKNVRDKAPGDAREQV